MCGRLYRFALAVGTAMVVALSLLPMPASAATPASAASAPAGSGAGVQASASTKTPSSRERTPKPARRLTVQPNFSAEKAAGPRGAASTAPRAVAAPQPPFSQCPAVGADTSCGILVQVTSSGTNIYSDAHQGPYDGADDTLVGVVNATGKTIQSLALSSDTNIFGFDSDGLCTFTPAASGCPFGPTGYEGPNTSFSNITPDAAGGVLNFTTGLAAGASAYFSLEEPLTATVVFGGGPSSAEQGGTPNPSEHVTVCYAKQPINCATGAFVHEFTDFSVPGRGVQLNFTRTYSSSEASTDGPLGFGWTHSYNMSLIVDAVGNVTVVQENGSTVPFLTNGSGGYAAPPRVLATLVKNSDGTHTFTRKTSQIRYVFSSTGQLTGETDLNGYTTKLSYSGSQLSSVTDPGGRKLSFTYSGAHIARVTDPMGRGVSFTYDAAGNLGQTTDAAGHGWKFGYDPSHLLLTMTNPRNGVVRNTYDSSARVISQVDAAGLKTSWAYAGDPATPSGGDTTITDEHRNVTVEHYANLELLSITRGAGTAAAATTNFTYDPATLGRTSVTDPDGHSTKNTYDSNGNLLTTTDALGNTTSYGYNSFNELARRTTPKGESTVLTYDSSGNPTALTDAMGKMTAFAYTDAQHPGDLTSVTDPDGRTKTMTYDAFGDTVSLATSPASGMTNTTKTAYDLDGEPVCVAPPNTVATGGSCPTGSGSRTLNTATWSYDAVGNLTAFTDPAGHTSKYAYDAANNLLTETDALGNLTTRTHDADNRLLSMAKGANSPGASTTRTAYDLKPSNTVCSTAVAGAKYCTATTDPNGQVTVDYFGPRDQLLSEVRAGGQATGHAYDLAGNETTRTDAVGRTTAYTYDADNRPVSITYSDGKTPKVTYAYDADSHRTSMTDGTGTTTYSYDADGRLASVSDGAGSQVAYNRDGAGNVTTLTYPSNRSVSRAYDGADQMTSVTDWNGHVVHFGYDANGNLVNTGYPNGDSVTSTYDPDNEMMSTATGPTGSPGSPLAKLTYTRNADELVTQEAGTGVTAGTRTYAYDAKLELTTESGSSYTYDLAGNPTKLASRISQSFDSADEIIKSTSNASSTAYGFDKVGDRIDARQSDGAITSYSYDQANRLSSVTATAPPPAPVVTSISPNSGPEAGGTTVTIVGSNLSGATEVKFGSTGAKFTVVSDASITATSPGGKGTVDIKVSTANGVSARVAADRFTYKASSSPVVTAITPHKGSGHGGDLVLIFGKHLRGVKSVHFGNQAAQFLEVPSLPDVIFATSPPGSGTVEVTVTTRDGTSAKIAADRFTYTTCDDDADHRHSSVRDSNSNECSADSEAASPRMANTSSIGSPVVPGASPTTTTTIATYTYNGDGLRSSKQTASGSEQFTWDPSSLLPLLLVDGSTSFVYGPGGLPLEQVDNSGHTNYFFHDQLGSTRVLLDGSGTATATFAYDAYGRTIATTGTSRSPFLYAGGYRDVESGLYYLVHRYYDPRTAQFLTTDPALDISKSPYGYVGNDPINGRDPGGQLFGIDNLVGAVVGAVTGGASAAFVDFVTQGKVDWADVAGATVGGFVGGGVCGIELLICQGAVSGFVGSVASDVFHSRKVNWTEAVTNAGVGAAFGAVGEAFKADDVALGGRSALSKIWSGVTDKFGGLEAVTTTMIGTDVHLVLNPNEGVDVIDPATRAFQPSTGSRYVLTC